MQNHRLGGYTVTKFEQIVVPKNALKYYLKSYSADLPNAMHDGSKYLGFKKKLSLGVRSLCSEQKMMASKS